MDQEPDVGLVYAHAEGGRRADRANFVAYEPVLIGRSLLVRQARMVGQGREAARGKIGGEGLGPGAGEAIHDARAFGALGGELEHLIDGPRAAPDLQEDVRPVEPGDEGPRSAQAQLGRDILPHSRRGGRREGEAGDSAALPAGARPFAAGFAGAAVQPAPDVA